MELFILRHGEAGERSSSLVGDKKRPLTSSGKLEVSEIALGRVYIRRKIYGNCQAASKQKIQHRFW
jgi:hypothetical protein